MKREQKKDQNSRRELSAEERMYMASQWRLMARRFFRHKIAVSALAVLGIFYILAIFCPFFAPYGKNQRLKGYIHAPPHKVHFVDESGEFHLRPFVYPHKQELNEETLSRNYTPDKSEKHFLKFFVEGKPYTMLGIIKSRTHFIGTEKGKFLLFGADEMGRDLFSRILFGARVSLTIGLVGVFLALVLGTIMGGISGYYGGKPDMLIQRVIEFIMSIPAIPFWMALSAALPPTWSVIMVYFAITVILSLRRWCGIARVVRGKFLQLREEDFVVAAKAAGASESRIMFVHMVPSFLSWIIVRATIMIPGMIIAETGLSFLGLGIRPPAVSWGALLKSAQNVQNVLMYPWILIPGIFVVIAVLAYNFVGDGLRDAADPYQ